MVCAMCSLVALPNLNQITFGGGPFNVAISLKSESWVTIVKPFDLQKAQISKSLAFVSPADFTVIDSLYCLGRYFVTRC